MEEVLARRVVGGPVGREGDLPARQRRYVQLGASRAQARLVSSERGQSTAEYALVLGLIVALVVAAFTQKDLFAGLVKKAVDLVTGAIK